MLVEDALRAAFNQHPTSDIQHPIFTRRNVLSWLALPAARLCGQGMASRNVRTAPRGKRSGLPFHARFTDVARQAGLREISVGGHADHNDYIIECMSCGAAFFDYDSDGWLDILVLSGSRFGDPPATASNRLYKNNRDGTFTDVTEKAGLFRTGYAYGVTVGDYNNDGFEDLFITYWGQNALYHNNGDGTFSDVTKAAGLLDPQRRFGSGCTFLDYDRDGKLDLFVANYLVFDPDSVPRAGASASCDYKGVPVNCGPKGLPYGHHSLYRNNGDGTFSDVTAASGIGKVEGGYGLTAVAADFDNDGWPDVYVACDSTPSLLFRNNHVVYVNDGRGNFRDMTLRSGLGVETRFVSWGAGVADLDNDGNPDIFLVTGGIYPEVEKKLPNSPYKTSRVIFRNMGKGQFEELVDEAGPGVAASHSSRGCAFGDFDNDGDVDIVIVNQNEPPSLLRNDVTGGHHWIKIKLTGVQSNRSAIGARVTAHYGGKTQAQEVLSQSSYLSVNDSRLHFGLGPATAADLEIRWPSGQVEKLAGVAANRLIYVTEGSGITRTQSFK
jgi:hypothetical protein